MISTTDTRPYFYVYGDTATSTNADSGVYRTFEEAKMAADKLVKQGRILVHIRREEFDYEVGIELELVVWAAASPEVDWR